jgi:Na+/H+ antiporter NhaB
VVAALATQTGALLPGGCNKAEALMLGLTSMDQLKRVVAEAETHRVQLPDFGLPLY